MTEVQWLSVQRTFAWGRYIPHMDLFGWWVKLGPFTVCGYKEFGEFNTTETRVEIRFDACREIDPYSEDRLLILG